MKKLKEIALWFKNYGIELYSVHEQIAVLTKLHMIRTSIDKNNYNGIVRKTLRQLMNVGLTYTQLAKVIWSDLCGRPPLEKPDFEQVCLELYHDHAMNVYNLGEMEPIVTGKILLELGLKPGPLMGEIINQALKMQDKGTLDKDNWMERLRGCNFKTTVFDKKNTI